jgi:uroporphyrinogen-III synthase
VSLDRWTVVVARDDAPDDEFSQALLAARVGVVPLRLMRTERLDVEIDGEFDVVAYCSKNAVDATGGDRFGAATVAAVGVATAARLAEHGAVADVVGDAGGAALGALLVAKGVQGKRVLLPRAEGGNDELKDSLEGAGAVVVGVDVYRSVAVEVDAAAVVEVEGPRALLLTSPKRARELVEKVRLPDDVVVVALGETTAAALREFGHRVDVVLPQPTPEALLDALQTQQNRR